MEQILSSCKFWFSILTAEGKMVDEMKQHSKVKIVEAAVKNTISAINTQRINSKFLLLLLNKEIESKSLLYCMCEEKSKLEKTIKKYQNMLSDYQNDLKMIDDTFRKMKTIPVRKLQLLLNKSLDYIKARTNELIQGNITVQELSKTTPDIQIVQDISERCKHITSVVATCVFGNLTRQYFENNEEET
ncbi:unnamed protein product [Mytilus edulis]|uniref:Uncharacterized protein n=1 Tax=Mytilus edulis TaxID=6550 RepID=A0A8S3RYR5_MYTED|nr:unnamed protein product [Mytilus edulis]